jgi:citrate/tricarballylate utilization protein
MPLAEILTEAERIITICNACRYCEGICAVFPAMERRRTFSDKDLIFLSNLCHNCRGCYYACQYAPPHEFNVNVPKTLQKLRVRSYVDGVWPGFLAGMFQRNGLIISLSTVTLMIFIALFVFSKGASVVFSSHLGGGAFYRIIPYAGIIILTSLISLYALVTMIIGVFRLLNQTDQKLSGLFKGCALLGATADTLRLRYLGGGGHGCNYPDESFSYARRRLHHMVFYGFLLTLTSTMTAAFYENFMSRTAPYPFWSLPVIMGTLGGLMLMIGSGGMFIFKMRSDKEPSNPELLGMDLVFSMLLFLISLTGLLLLVLRETPVMGILFIIHFGLVLGFFLTLPYGKFLHALYRYAALVQNAVEASNEEP